MLYGVRENERASSQMLHGVRQTLPCVKSNVIGFFVKTDVWQATRYRMLVKTDLIQVKCFMAFVKTTLCQVKSYMVFAKGCIASSHVL